MLSLVLAFTSKALRLRLRPCGCCESSADRLLIVRWLGSAGVTEVLLRGREAGLSREYDQWPYWERQALNELRRYRRVFPLGAAQCGLWTGVAHWLDGQKDQALVAWNEALANARRLSLRQDESMIAAEMRRRKKQV